MNLKKIPRLLLTGTVLLLASATSAYATDSFPSQPVRIIVGSAPGGLLDITTRVVAQRMGEVLGQSVIVENRPGAGTVIATRGVKAAAADGYTLISATTSIAMQPAVRLNPGYDLLKDFTGIGPMTRAPLLMLARPNASMDSLADFMSLAKAQPGKLTYASSGIGGSIHLGTASFAQAAGLNLSHIPYKANSTAWPDVIGGRVDTIFEPYGSAAPMLQDGRLKAIGITSTKRLKVLPDVPTMAESGVPSYNYYIWLGMFAPAGTPPDVVQRLSKALQETMATPELQKRFADEGSESMLMSADEFNQFIKQETEAVSKLVTDLGVPKQ
ncbi:ABC transporter substrate-binding protein [Pollutimonas nitritireducens]|uniref:ABC transporter substrate-binding protein n=1 Tax=Pollutimonas nitritireducens TaxID=2045209 RepID=A0A2N4ULP0_9BURK|nr:tripartite tricarboxylate transporter substrate binding protein [Pollutimonas nitritireducens]PLC55905.1 ABC transporter substrate-binding protein [Pollutimonas nitritireducens]